MTNTLPFFYGALTFGCAIVALFFVRYYRLAKDPLFIWFAMAFAVFATQWSILSFGLLSEHTHLVYLVRLLGFVMILIGIVGKNRTGRAP